jgi:uncharacterized membrane protein
MRHTLTWLTIAYPLTVHALILSGHSLWAAYVLAPLALLHALLAAKLRLWGGLLLALGILALCGVDLALGRAHAMYLPPIIWSALLLALFGGSLLPSREPLITRFARVLMDENDTGTRRYTRQVTALWTAFFAVQLLANAALALFASVELWSLFANLLNYAFIAVLFLAELLYRLVVRRSHSAGRFFTAMRHADFAALMRDPP